MPTFRHPSEVKWITLMPERHDLPSAPTALEALRATIEGLYAVFAAYTLPPEIEGCPHCVTTHDQERLRAKPLRELAVEDLDNYAISALTTWGTERDFKHFLPRLFELMALQWQEFLDAEVLIGKLEQAGWRHWPEEERTAIEAYLMALWRRVLTSFDGSLDASDCLCGIAQAIDDLQPYLAIWQSDHRLPALFHLNAFLDHNGLELFRSNRLSNAHWSGRSGPMRQVVEWLLDPRTRDAYEQAFFADPDSEAATELAQIVDWLTWLQRAVAEKRRAGGEENDGSARES